MAECHHPTNPDAVVDPPSTLNGHSVLSLKPDA